MLNNVPKILSPELLKTLCEMGHSDVIVLGDGNFPGDRFAHEGNCKFLRCDGHGVPEILDAILRFFPLDTSVEKPVALMAVAPGDTAETPIWDTYKEIVARYDPRGAACFEEIEKNAFYHRTQDRSSVVIMSGETALYANIILRKGVVLPE